MTSETQTYQAMYREVESLIQGMSHNQLDLDSMVGQVERGYELIKKLQARLNETSQKIEKLRDDFAKELAGQKPSEPVEDEN